MLGAASLTLDQVVRRAAHWAAVLVLFPVALACAALISGGPQPRLTAVLILDLLAFGFVFAINSSVNSYLIPAFSRNDRVTMDVGFYYMSNAAGGRIGTLSFGPSYQLDGLPLRLDTAAAMVGLSWLCARVRTRAHRRSSAVVAASLFSFRPFAPKLLTDGKVAFAARSQGG